MAKTTEKAQAPIPDWVAVESKLLSGHVEDFYDALGEIPEATNGILANRRIVTAAESAGIVTFAGEHTQREMTIPEKDTLAATIVQAVQKAVAVDPN